MKKETLLSLPPKTFSDLTEARKHYRQSKARGVYAFQIDNLFYIGSTFMGFATRFKAHFSSIATEIKGTRLKGNGGDSLYPRLVGVGLKNVPIHILYEDSLGLNSKEELNNMEVGLMRAYNDAGFDVISDDGKLRSKAIHLTDGAGNVLKTSEKDLSDLTKQIEGEQDLSKLSDKLQTVKPSRYNITKRLQNAFRYSNAEYWQECS